MCCKRQEKIFNLETSSGDIALPMQSTLSLNSAPWIPRLGEIITVKAQNGKDYRARVYAISDSECRVSVFQTLPKNMESKLKIFLLQALPDKERMEWIIQKATELGVTAIQPFSSDRSITIEEREKKQPKAHRWPEIAKRAAQQCRRNTPTQLMPYTDFCNALKQAAFCDLKLMLWEGEKESSLKSDQFNKTIHPLSIAIMIGPEGGFSEEEVEHARKEGFSPISLGPRILRTETATIAAIAIIQHIWGDMG